VVGKHLMTKNEKITLIIIGVTVLTIFGIGASNVFAETIADAVPTEETILIPFDPLGRVCGYDSTGIKWICEWDPNRINLGEVFTANNTAVDDPVEASTTICPDRFYLIDDGVTCMPVNCEDGYHHNTAFECVADPEPEIPILSKDHQRLIDKLDYYEDFPPKTFDQLTEKWKLEHLSLCWYGIDQARGIQTESSFVTSTWIEDQDKVYASNIYLIDRAITICTAQTTMLEILGDVRKPGDVRTKQGWWGIVSPSHGELAKDVPTWSQSRVNEEANMGITVSDRNPICALGSYYGEMTKRMYCADEFIPVNIHNNVITTQNDVEDKWIQYIEDDGVAQKDQIIADILAEKRKQLWAHNQVWKLSTETEQIYAIEKAGWSMYPEHLLPDICNVGELYRLEYLQKCGE